MTEGYGAGAIRFTAQAAWSAGAGSVSSDISSNAARLHLDLPQGPAGENVLISRADESLARLIPKML